MLDDSKSMRTRLAGDLLRRGRIWLERVDGSAFHVVLAEVARYFPLLLDAGRNIGRFRKRTRHCWLSENVEVRAQVRMSLNSRQERRLERFRTLTTF